MAHLPEIRFESGDYRLAAHPNGDQFTIAISVGQSGHGINLNREDIAMLAKVFARWASKLEAR